MVKTRAVSNLYKCLKKKHVLGKQALKDPVSSSGAEQSPLLSTAIDISLLYVFVQIATIGYNWLMMLMSLTNLYKSNNHWGFHPLRWTQPWAHQPRALLARIRWVGRRAGYCTTFLGKRAPMFGAGDRWGKEYLTAWKHLKGLERTWGSFCTFLTHLEALWCSLQLTKCCEAGLATFFLVPWELQKHAKIAE